MELLEYAEENAGIKIQVDMYGGGPNKDAAEKRADSLGVNMTFHGPIDHADLALTHKVSFFLSFHNKKGSAVPHHFFGRADFH